MEQLYVDTNGLNQLYNQMQRASDDAANTLDYVHKHCDLSFVDVGLIMRLISPHRKAYGELTSALERLQQLTQTAGTQVNRAQVAYSQTDLQAAAALDAAYPGAKDADTLRRALAEQQDPGVGGAAFADVTEPAQFLRNPEYAIGIEMWAINPMVDLISPAAWLRQTIIWVFGHDPLEGWASQFSGDWKAYVHCGQAMGQAGGTARAIGRNLIAGAMDVPEAWRGNAADGFREWDLSLGNATAELEQICQQYNTLYDQAAEAIKKLYDVTAGLISDLLDLMLVISGALAAGTATLVSAIGPITGYSIAAYYAWQAWDLYNEISKFYGQAEDLLKLIGGWIGGVSAALAVKDIPTIAPYHHPAGY
ncbi:hypothetical protein Acsp01_53820 [Actinoplanes sp. NBRC 101535]|nr:hypothetical protein Acsp01_53820 [Actinoplanes sp. NBRC 101535]